MKKFNIILVSIASVICCSFIQHDNAKKRKSKPKPHTSSTTNINSNYSIILENNAVLNKITKLLVTYDVYKSGLPIKMIRLGRDFDGGYILPELALTECEAVMGYGIADDISFEDQASMLYGIHSFGFDGTCAPITPRSNLCHYFPYNIESEQKIYNSQNNGQQLAFPSLSFSQQMELCGTKNKKILIKMDIEGAEYETIPDILQNSNSITGIVLEIHFCTDNEIAKALNLLEMIQKDFVLTHIHGNNYCKSYFTSENSEGLITRILELSYINKNLLDSYTVSTNQTHPKPYDMPNSPNEKDIFFSILDNPREK